MPETGAGSHKMHKKAYMNTIEIIIGTHPFWKGLNSRYFHILRECAAYSRFGLDQCIFEAGREAEHFYGGSGE